MFDDLGVEEYEVVATLDSHTSEICQNLNGKVFPIKDYPVGVTAPPFRVFCRSTTASVLGDHALELGGESIPEDMPFEEWERKFVKNGLTNVGNGDIINNNGLYHKDKNSDDFLILPKKMSKAHIRNLARKYGVDIKGLTINIDFNEELLRLPITGEAVIGTITFFPNAFVSEEMIIRTLYHDSQHVKQFRKYGAEYVMNNSLEFEKEAYEAEEKFIKKLRKEGKL